MAPFGQAVATPMYTECFFNDGTKFDLGVSYPILCFETVRMNKITLPLPHSFFIP